MLQRRSVASRNTQDEGCNVAVSHRATLKVSVATLQCRIVQHSRLSVAVLQCRSHVCASDLECCSVAVSQNRKCNTQDGGAPDSYSTGMLAKKAFRNKYTHARESRTCSLGLEFPQLCRQVNTCTQGGGSISGLMNY